MAQYQAVTDSYKPYGKRKELEILRGRLDTERSSWINHWRELADYILPRRGRFQVTDANRGERKSQKIIDSTATLSARTLRSGMMAGVTSPARPWFRLTTPDPDLAEFGPVKDWLHIVSQRMRTVFLRCNLYNSLPVVYGDLGSFGTGSMLVEEDFSVRAGENDVIRTYPFPIGSYMLAQNDRRKVDTFIREFRMTPRQLIEQFGYQDPGHMMGEGAPEWDRFSENVTRLYENGQTEEWIDVVHVIRPNPNYDSRRMGSEYKRYQSCYYERGSEQGGPGSVPREDKYLSESGYDYFPVLCPRWETTAEDVYGSSCPGMIALGDIKQLQTGEKRGAQAIEKMVNPPMVGADRLRTTRTSTLPGDITYIDEPGGSPGFRPAYETRFSLVELENKQAQVRQRIQRSFYEDLMLMLAMSDRRQITAREIEERHEEKLLALGPVLEQLNSDLLEPLIDITFNIMVRQGLIPEAPEEIQGERLKVEYISIMAQAQKLAGLAGIERFVGFVGQVAQVDPQVLDKIDRDQLIDEYADTVGVPPRIIVPDDQVVAIRAQRAQAQQAAQAAQAAEVAATGAKAAKDLSETKMDEDSALTRLVRASEAGQVV